MEELSGIRIAAALVHTVAQRLTSQASLAKLHWLALRSKTLVPKTTKPGNNRALLFIARVRLD